MSFLRPVDCPKCGAPLPISAAGASIAQCPYCEGTLATAPRAVFASRYERAFRANDEDADVRVLGVPYALERPLARGSTCDVFAGRRTRAPAERVLVKLLRDGADARALAHEVEVLEALAESDAPGASHFRQRLPQLVARGVCVPNGVPAVVFRRLSGFDHDARDVRRKYGDALDPRHAVWILRRVLELLSWVHASGFAHGAIAPEHLVINARDHGVMLVGWSQATRANFRADVAMAIRSIGWLLGSAPTPLADVLARNAAGGDPHVVEREVVAAARAAFGPSSFVPLNLD